MRVRREASKVGRCVVTLALLVAVGGCGGSEGSAGEAPPPDPEAAARTVERYFDALSGGAFAIACDQLTRDLQREAAEQAGQADCAAAVGGSFLDVPEELAADLSRVTAEPASADGRTVRFEGSGAFTEDARSGTVPMAADGGRWAIAELPKAVEADPVTTCVVGGIEGFEAGQADAFWRREGRGDFVEYLRRVCKQAARRGVEDAGGEVDRRALAEIQGDVLRAMIRAGRIERP